MKLIWRDQARSESREIVDYISDRNERAAHELQAKIQACAERLPDHPFLYRPGRV